MKLFAWPLALVLGACAGAGGGDGGREFVVESRDVRVLDAGRASPEGYEYVARRPLAVVALAESRGVDALTAHAAIDGLANALDTCATNEAHGGTLVPGAARVVAQIGIDGTVAQTSVRVDPGAGVVQNAVVCLLAPVKLLVFPPIDAGARAMAIEALWGSVVTGPNK